MVSLIAHDLFSMICIAADEYGMAPLRASLDEHFE
jgi:hypothetical protein